MSSFVTGPDRSSRTGNSRIRWYNKRLIGCALILLALPSGLSGCVLGENIGAVQVSVLDGTLAVAFCSSQTIETLRLEQLTASDERSKNWPQLWRSSDRVHVKAGDIIAVGNALSRESGVSYVDFDSTEGTEYRVYVESDEYGVYSPTIRSPEGGLKEGEWVSTDGRIWSHPCSVDTSR